VTPRFQADASYLIVGGLGGLGRAFVRWMADLGAKVIVALSRSGMRHPRAAQLVAEMKQRDIKLVVLACDVADAAVLRTALLDAAKGYPPIRGMIQAAMVLQVRS